jgi:hypothetical protein
MSPLFAPPAALFSVVGGRGDCSLGCGGLGSTFLFASVDSLNVGDSMAQFVDGLDLLSAYVKLEFGIQVFV